MNTLLSSPHSFTPMRSNTNLCAHCGDTSGSLRHSSPNKPEPPPLPNDSPAIWDLVIKDMAERDRGGREKYGTPLQAHNGRDPLVDAYQEALDLCVYLRQAIEERGAGK